MWGERGNVSDVVGEKWMFEEHGNRREEKRRGRKLIKKRMKRKKQTNLMISTHCAS